MKNYVKGYPRPQFIRDSWELLDGIWKFAVDSDGIGEKEQWFCRFPEGKQILVPFTYETEKSGIHDESAYERIWYHREFEIAEDTLHDRNLLLHFEGSDYITKVWINGIYIGVHKGAYTRFSFDISNAVKAGVNTVTVEVEDRMDEQQPRGKQRWVPENYACWYVQTTGIWKSVWMEQVPKEAIAAAKLTPSVSAGNLEIELDTNVREAARYVRVLVEYEGQKVTEAVFPVADGRVKGNISVYNKEIFEWGIKTWSTEHPDLYDITFTLCTENKRLDTVRSYFGMREIGVHNTNILLNGKPIYQRLILDQGYWKETHLTPPDDDALKADVEKIIAMGYNGVRKHQKTEDERFLYWCDVLGLYVWSEVGSNYVFGDQGIEDFTEQWVQIVKQNYNHPSIITWVPFNESWGIPNVMTNKKQQNFTKAIYYLTKSIDPMRLVVSNDGWEQTKTDIVTMHDYEQIAELLKLRYKDHMDEVLCGKIYHNGFKCAFAEGSEYEGQPIIISEFGGIAFDNDDSGWGYGNKAASKEEFIKRLDDIVTAVKQIPGISGYCYTQVSDVQQEINGLLDETHEFKIDSEIIKEINTRYTGCYQRIYN